MRYDRICVVFWGSRAADSSRRNFGIQAKVKTRPYLLALQAAFAAIIIGQFAVTLGEAGVAPVFFFNQFMSVTFGVMFSHFFGAWLLITLVFFVRFRNHNARIFTRNRDQ